MNDLPEELTRFITRRFVYFFAGQIGDEIDVGVERSSRGLIDLRMTVAEGAPAGPNNACALYYGPWRMRISLQPKQCAIRPEGSW